MWILPAPKKYSYSGVGLLLSDHFSKCVTYNGNFGSRIVYARINARLCNLFVIGVYIPHLYRTEPPFFNDTLDHLDKVLQKVTAHDCAIILGDLNCKLVRSNLIKHNCAAQTSPADAFEHFRLMQRVKLFQRVKQRHTCLNDL